MSQVGANNPDEFPIFVEEVRFASLSALLPK